MLKQLALAGVTSALLINVANAQDVEPTVFSWTGAYIGLQAGYAWNDQPVNWDINPPTPVDIDVDSIDVEGFVGGLYAGHLWQSNSLVFGVEGDIEYSDIKGSTTFELPPVDIADIDSRIDWLGSLRLRLGWAMDRVLIYATGGVAVGGVELEGKIDQIAVGIFTDETDSGTKWGYTIGGGLDYAIDDAVSIRLEYRYTDLGKSEVTFTNTGRILTEIDNEVRNDFHAVRAGISWRFQ